jgi:hypothetical protein
MLIQLFAEVQDTLEDDLKMATAVAKAFNMNVSFYFDRVEYYINAGGVVTTRKHTLEAQPPKTQEKKGK